MKNKWIFFTLFVFTTTLFAQQKEFTLKESVLQQYRAFAPKHTNSVSWIPGTDTYSYVSSDYKTLFKNGVKKDEPVQLLTLEELNQICGTTMSYISILQWKDASSFYVSGANKYFLVNLTDKKST
ncbi:MAG: hypothetical protein JNJ99_11500, partial [Crocinitomicaceae bacterium]|nr:hypothetical protein [Crocinitomicaceae bacterium]